MCGGGGDAAGGFSGAAGVGGVDRAVRGGGLGAGYV